MLLYSLFFASSALAYPYALEQLRYLNARDLPAEGNCGPVPCVTFNAKEQYVDVTEETGHQFIAPKPSDSRGPCPGLNAAANHAFLPRSGILNTEQTITGLAEAYSMGADLAAGLAVVAILLDGDPIAGTWSIGGAYPDAIIDSIGEEPQGISWSHNQYEGDSSVTRQDAYLNDGDASSLIISRFEALYSSAEEYTLENLRGQFAANQKYSIENNPFYFSAQFSGLLVVPAAHNFIINFFSNHSSERPAGWLDRETLKTFFGVSGEPGSFQYHAGQEAIPQNWYKRPLSNAYDLSKALADVARGYLEDPSTLKFGGNTGSVDSFVGIDLGDLTGGVYNSESLLQGNNLGCFALQAQQMDFPDSLKGLKGDLSPATKLLEQYFNPLFSKLDCPTLNTYNQGLFNKFAGYRYRPNSTDPNGLGIGSA